MRFFTLILWILPIFSLRADYDPVAVYLNWQHSPTTTMTVQWITEPERTNDVLEYRKEGDSDWIRVNGTHFPMPEKEPYLVHRKELTKLEPDTIYAFRIGSDGKIYQFRTMPAHLSKPIRFVEGGDCFHDNLEVLQNTNRLAAQTNPMFCVIGGDIAYGGAKKGRHSKERQKRWLVWLSQWKETMITPEGLLIPMVICIGNHDVIGGYGQPKSNATFFYSLFPLPEDESFYTLDFGNYMSLVVLDSGHTNEIFGNQANWLYHALQERQHVPSTFAFYHVPAWPSVRKSNGKQNQRIRMNWVPIFEKFGLTSAFEHHDHAYKRTPLIYKGQINDEKGVLYLGDGAWGVKKAREPKDASKHWYLEKTSKKRNFILVTIDGFSRHFQAINEKGEVFDSYTLTEAETPLSF